jgi:uncharacterized protein YhaN
LLRLDLLAWGPFTERRLELGNGSSGLQIIYGDNEAGKSTTMRGIRALLYGVDHVTSDAWLHPGTKLRVGALVAGEDGAPLEVVRRKGKKDTLLDAAGAPIDEGQLQKLLHGVGAEQFVSMFGLDHEALRRGGQALLDGGGELGESLFDAALGGVGLHQLQKKLAEEAAALFAPRAQRPLNRALDDYNEARKLSTQSAASVTAWRDNEVRLTEERKRQEGLRALLAELRRERHRAARLRQALPLCAERARAREARQALGEVPVLPADAATRRREAEQIVAAAARVDEDLLRKREEAAALPASGAVLDDAEALRGELARYRRSAHELPELRAELAAVENDIARLRAELGGRTPAKRVDVATIARLKAQAARRQELARAIERARGDERAAVALVASRAAPFEAVPPNDGGDAVLRAALAAADRLGDVDGRIAALGRERDELRRANAARLAALGVTVAPSGVPPTPAAVDEALEAVAGGVRNLAALEERQTDAAARAAALAAELAALVAQHQLPSEAELRAARATRDRLLDENADPATLRAAIASADDVVDRLRRDAAEVGQRARLDAERAGRAAEAELFAERRDQAAKALTKARTRLAKLFADADLTVGVARLAPVDVRALAAALADLPSLDARRTALDADLAAAASARDGARAALAAALATSDPGGALAPVSQAGAASLASIAERHRRREALEIALSEAQANAAAAAARTAELCRQEEAAAADWSTAVAALGLEAATSDEIGAIFDHAQRLWQLSDRAEALARPIDTRAREAEAFAAIVAAAEQSTGTTVPGPLEARAAALIEAADAAREARSRRRQLDADTAALVAEAERIAAAAAAAQALLAELCAAAGVASPSLMPPVEARVAEATRLDAKLDELERALAIAAEGPPDALIAELADVDVDRLHADEDDLDDRIKSAEEELESSLELVGTIEAGMRNLEEGSNAAQAAEDAQIHLARSRDLAARFIRLRLARAVLEAQLQAYRHNHQGPVLSRAGELFARLTRGHYTGLAPGFDETERAVLRARQSGGAEVDVVALSDGTRDQLYLALRLATLERHASLAPPMPLVVDDILIHFDDDRAAAALEALTELTPRMQVLFFTHHARLAELAKTLGATVHQL